jgi:hypothetical protein
MDFKLFAEANRLRTKWNGVENLVFGRCGEIADIGDDGRLRLRLLAVPRAVNLDRTPRSRRAKVLAGGPEGRHLAGADSVFLFDPADSAQAHLAIRLVGTKRRRVLSPEQRQVAADRLAATQFRRLKSVA